MNSDTARVPKHSRANICPTPCGHICCPPPPMRSKTCCTPYGRKAGLAHIWLIYGSPALCLVSVIRELAITGASSDQLRVIGSLSSSQIFLAWMTRQPVVCLVGFQMRTSGCHSDFILAPENPEQVLNVLAADETKIVPQLNLQDTGQ